MLMYVLTDTMNCSGTVSPTKSNPPTAPEPQFKSAIKNMERYKYIENNGYCGVGGSYGVAKEQEKEPSMKKITFIRKVPQSSTLLPVR